MDDALDPEILEEFISESRQGLQSVEQDVLSLEADGGEDVELVNRIFRAVHSIKGAASFFSFTNLVTVSHRAETLLDDIRSGRRTASADVTDAVLGAMDTLATMLDESDQGATHDCHAILEQLDAVLNTELNGGSSAATAEVKDEPAQEEVANETTETQELPDMDDEIVIEFVTESKQGLDDIEQDLLELENSSEDSELINRIFRAIHSIKGAAGFLGLTNLVETTHRAETILDRIRSGKMEPTAAVTDVVLCVVDAVKEMLGSPDLGASYECEEIIARLEAVLNGTTSSSDEKPLDPAVLKKIQEDDEITDPVYRVRVELARLHKTIDVKEGIIEGLHSFGKIVHSSIPLDKINGTLQGQWDFCFATGIPKESVIAQLQLEPAQVTELPKAGSSKPEGASAQKASAPKASSPQPPSKAAEKSKQDSKPKKPAGDGGRAAPEQTMRVPARILHEMLEWTGNMVMARNQLLSEYDFRESNAFRTLSQAITGVHETVIETRMQTTGSLFERYRRVIRDLSRQLKKEVAFHIEGGDLELDRTILESFADPLTHLVRNCADHALETPEERIAAGKNRQGNVYLRSYIQSGEIILAVQDDGRGISADYVCNKAISKGILTEEEAADLTDDQKVMLIFEPGFSTKEQATDVSGRGVGMDVVRNNIEKVGGTIALKTKVGMGSTFSAHLPLAKALVSSSLTTALIVEIDNERFAIPETAISEIISYDSEALESVRLVDGCCVYQHRDQLVAIIDLRSPLGMAESADTEKTDIDSSTKPFAPKARSSNSCIVIIQFRDQLFGTVVDQVVGMQEIIVRSNPLLTQECTVYSGHTVLGNGRIALILDINGIVSKMSLKFPDQVGARDQRSGPRGAKDDVASQKMLIFNNSDTEYFAIPIELVAFIERIDQTDLRRVGEKEYCQLKAETLATVRLEDHLPISPINRDRNDMCLIRPAAIEHPVGVITGLDMTVVDVQETFDSRLDDGHGIVGTFYHNEKLVMLLDMFRVLESHAPEKLKESQPEEKQRAKILAAEDSLFFRTLIQQYIASENWEVEIFEDGLAAYDQLMNNPTRYDLVVSDINMPRMDGFEFVQKIREDKRFDRLPVVALTTMSEDEYQQKGLRLGFDRYVIKIDKREVRATVAECLRIKRDPNATRD